MTALVECIPNFSEGRDASVVGAIASAAASAPGCALLDIHSDPWHHRSVITLAGSREAVRRIDLTAHAGEHPRIGAADVAPLSGRCGTGEKHCPSPSGNCLCA